MINGVYGKPYIDFSSLVDTKWLSSLHDEFSHGIAKSHKHKSVVSCGVHPGETELEACSVIYNPEKYLNQTQLEQFHDMTVEEKIWYVSLILPVYHPYYICSIRYTEDFSLKNKSEFCHWGPNSDYFPSMRGFVNSLPFKSIGRVLFFITEHNHRTLIHFDARNEELRNRDNHDFLTMWTIPDKKLFIYDPDTEQRHYVNTPAAYWNELDWHGTDPCGRKTFTFRVEGIFQDDVREMMEIGDI